MTAAGESPDRESRHDENHPLGRGDGWDRNGAGCCGGVVADKSVKIERSALPRTFGAASIALGDQGNYLPHVGRTGVNQFARSNSFLALPSISSRTS